MIFGAKKNPFIRKTTIRIKKSIHTFLFVILHQETCMGVQTYSIFPDRARRRRSHLPV